MDGNGTRLPGTPDPGLPLALAEAHGFNAAVYGCGHPAVGAREWVRRVVAAAGGYVGRFPGLPEGDAFLAFVPADAPSGPWRPVMPCDQVIALWAKDAAFPAAAARERARAYAELLAGLCGGHRPLEASWRCGSLSLDLARAVHAAGPALQRGHAFFPVPGSPPEPARAEPAVLPRMGRRIRSAREEGGNGFLLSAAETGEALVVLGPLPAGCGEAAVRLEGGAATVLAGGTAVAAGPLPEGAERALRRAGSIAAASLREDGSVRVLASGLLEA